LVSITKVLGVSELCKDFKVAKPYFVIGQAIRKKSIYTFSML